MKSNQSNTNRHILISLFGYSQSGKTSRNECIENHLRRSVVVGGGNFTPINLGIRITAGSQSRHITPKGFNIIMQHGEITTISVDYTGQDHIAAYYVILGMLQLIDNIEGDEELSKALPDVIKRIAELSEKILNLFKRPTTEFIDKEEFINLIQNPYEPLLDAIKNHIDQNKFDKIKNNAELIYNNNLQISMMLSVGYGVTEDVFNQIKLLINKELINKDIINVVELNRILCKIDKIKNIDTAKKNIDYDDEICDKGLSNVNIEDLSWFQYLRYIITGPLLAYLLIGFMIYSDIVYLMIPSNKEMWYQQIINIYGGKELQNILMILLKFLIYDPRANSVVNTACREFIHSKIGEYRELIEKICNRLRYPFTQEESDSKLNEDLKTIRSLQNLTELYEGLGGSLPKLIEKLIISLEKIGTELSKRGINREGFLTYVTGSIFNRYHFELFNLLLRILEKYLKNLKTPDHKTDHGKSFIISLTYSDNMKLSDFYNRIERGAGLYDFETDFRNIINGLKNIGVRNVYVIPSSFMAGECTVFETAMLICILESTATITVSYSPGADATKQPRSNEFTINCSALLNETLSLFDAFFAKKSMKNL